MYYLCVQGLKALFDRDANNVTATPYGDDGKLEQYIALLVDMLETWIYLVSSTYILSVIMTKGECSCNMNRNKDAFWLLELEVGITDLIEFEGYTRVWTLCL